MGKKNKAKSDKQTLNVENQPAIVPTKKPRRVLGPPRPRAYDLAKVDAQTASWRGQHYSPNESLRLVLPRMRARSRELWENNDYAKAFGRQLKANVFGPKGIIHQSKIKNTRGRLNKTLNAAIEMAYAIQSDKANWSADKRLTRRAFGRRWIETVARDGAALIRIYRGFANNQTGFSVYLMEADYLADDYFSTAANGNRIEAGVEQNEFGEAVAYYLYSVHPGSQYGREATRGHITRVPASEVLYTYMAEDSRPEQSIGVPWIHTAARRLRQVGEYEQAQLVAAVVGSRKMGFLSPSLDTAGLYDTGETDAYGNLVSEVAAGTIEELPPGYDFKTFDPTFPHQELPNFIKAMLRGTAAGLGPSYHSLSGDLESVNYSSIRTGLLGERDCWRLLQDFAIEDLERELFGRWLEFQIIREAFPATNIMRMPEIMMQQRLQPRGWEYVDAQKEVSASIDRINAGLSSPSLELAKLGLDIEDVYMMIEQDRALAEEHGLTDFLTVFSNNGGGQAQQPVNEVSVDEQDI